MGVEGAWVVVWDWGAAVVAAAVVVVAAEVYQVRMVALIQ